MDRPNGRTKSNINISESIETPCIVIDMKQVKKNIQNMQSNADRCGCRLRPHIKTHKTIELAKLQIAAGAVGITCAKVSEAEVMADGGLDDIFVAYPLVGASKIKRAIALRQKVKRLILAVDSIACAQALSEAIQTADMPPMEVRLEVDTGAKRTGVLREQAIELAIQISSMPGLCLTGIYTFKSLIYQNRQTVDASLAGEEEATLLHEVAATLEKSGISITDISAGSTPTGIASAQTGLVNEIRPGTYIFYDQMTWMEKACAFEDIAAHIYATVVSTPSPEYAVLDGGIKTFCTDVLLNQPPLYFEGYAYICGREDLVLSRMNEEHGMVTSKLGDTKLRIGDVLKLIPAHICPAVNLQNRLYIMEDDAIRSIAVDARGMVI